MSKNQEIEVRPEQTLEGTLMQPQMISRRAESCLPIQVLIDVDFVRIRDMWQLPAFLGLSASSAAPRPAAPVATL